MEVILAYDIQQRELAAQDPEHDLSMLDMEAFTVVSMTHATA